MVFRQRKDWGDFIVRPTLNEPFFVTFTLSTSWKPERAREGWFRYKISAQAKGVDADRLSEYIKTLHSCTFYLELTDNQGFRLRSVETTFAMVVDQSGKIVGLLANDMEPMNLPEYESFFEGGGWSMSWKADGPCS